MSADTNTIAVFPPGEFIKDELEARGWSQSDLADILDRSQKLVSEIVSGKRAITPETAAVLGEAFGTGAQVWLNLESAYRLSLTRGSDGRVTRKARLYEKAPVKEMIRRGWIEAAEDIGELEGRVMRFLGISSLNEEPKVLAAARAHNSDSRRWTPTQVAWLKRAEQLGGIVHAAQFSRAAVNDAIERMRALFQDPENARLVPRMLADAGVRFVVIEHTSGSKIDAATLWLGTTKPVVAMSMRYDRIDYFWHTLLHELRHVLQGHGGLDVNISGPEATQEGWGEEEIDANDFAAETMLPRSDLNNFIARVRPLYSKKRIVAFAEHHMIHPAIVLGQLKHRGEVRWQNLVGLHAKVRDIVCSAALCDGWGHLAPRDLT